MTFDIKTGIFLFLKERGVFDKGLAKEIVAAFPPQKAADLGCANGMYVDFLNKNGWEVTGYEGGETGRADIIRIDLSKPQNIPAYPLVLFLEVGEHIPKEKENILLDNVCNTVENILIISWANYTQKGKGHVNCKSKKEIFDIFTNKGFEELPLKSERLRLNSKKRWFKNNIMVFRRT